MPTNIYRNIFIFSSIFLEFNMSSKGKSLFTCLIIVLIIVFIYTPLRTDKLEQQFVRSIISYANKISISIASYEKKKLLKGGPFADPFIIAKAKIINAVVVSQEKYKENAVKIPNICKYFNIECINLEGFLTKENWKF